MSGGDPKHDDSADALTGVLPAWAGVILFQLIVVRGNMCFTRMSGGDPLIILMHNSGYWFYPHERGWSLIYLWLAIGKMVLPAWAGVIPNQLWN